MMKSMQKFKQPERECNDVFTNDTNVLVFAFLKSALISFGIIDYLLQS